MKQGYLLGRLFILFLLVFALFGSSKAQNLKRVDKAFVKLDMPDAREQIDKAIEKDFTHFGSYYFLSQYFLDTTLNQYDLDSARIFINLSLQLLDSATTEQMEIWSKTEISISKIDSLKSDITSRAFDKYQNPVSIGSMNLFMTLFPDAPQTDRAIFMRDSLAFEKTNEEYTWQAFQKYMETYPASHLYAQAKTLYDKLLYKSKTKSETLQDYLQFLDDNPETPYRTQAEEIIFKKMTLAHQTENYIDFINRFPASHLRKKAADMLYYQYKLGKISSFKNVLSLHPDKDSLININKLEEQLLIPLYIDGKYQFMDPSGKSLDKLTFDEIQEEYYCDAISDEWILGKKNDHWVLSNRHGYVLMTDIKSMEPVGEELMLVGSGSSKLIFHKTGNQVSDLMVEEAKIVFKEWILFKRDSYWGIMSFNGEIILQPKYKNINQQGNFLILESSREMFGISNATRTEKVYRKQASIDLIYDDYEVIGDSLFIGFDGDKETLIDEDLKEIIPLADHQIHINQKLWYLKQSDQYYLLDKTSKTKLQPSYHGLAANSGWLASQDTSTWKVENRNGEVLLGSADSIRLITDEMLFYGIADQQFLLFQNGTTFELGSKDQFQLIGPPDSTGFVAISSGSSQEVLNMKGERMFIGRFDKVEYLNQIYLIVKYRNKYGIYILGKGYLLRPTYDLIHADPGLTYLLKNNQIGCVNGANGTVIPPEYEARIAKFGLYYLVSKNGKQGLINDDNKAVVPIVYDEIKEWNDSSYWARQDDKWQLISYAEEVLVDNVKGIRKLMTREEDQNYLFMGDDGYGIIHPEYGIIIKPQYNDILNLGTETNPIYFTEQHLKTAEFYVVTYFNSLGEPIKSQAYRSHEYENIYCDQ